MNETRHEVGVYTQTLGTSGPDVVLVHGWGLSAAVWRDVAPRLAESFRVTLVDLPGHGRSAQVPFGGLGSVVARLRAVLPPSASWIGWSLGGLVALAYAERYPDAVSRVVTVATNPRFVRGEDWPAAMEPGVLAAFSQGLVQDYATTLSRFLALQFHGLKEGREGLKALRACLLDYPPAPQALREGLAVLRDTDLRGVLRDLTCPVRMIFGERDTLVPVVAAQAVAARAPRLRCSVVARAGHAPFLSHPEAFFEALTACLHD